MLEQHLTELEQLKFRRGLRVIMKNLLISATIYLSSYLLGIFFHVLVAHGCYFMIRYFSFGAHLKNFWLCFVQSWLTFVGVPFLLVYKLDLRLLIPGLLAAAAICWLGPQPTRAQPIHAYMLEPLKLKVRVTVGILLLVSLIIPNGYRLMMYYGIIVQALTLVITYMRRN
ncbi:accessory gene regulator B family protein [Macrococcus brunensis]|uniref:accessory gene regulator B family protein n=1 Tax=Macrococcus brunensis TaxID=198483 RepID=UPI001EF0A94C|nr:accessory gene regulator B family protein [Macrococcus brunensis]ULG74466.1 accessory gene regulator B family protein [Macrococcus brunensis]